MGVSRGGSSKADYHDTWPSDGEVDKGGLYKARGISILLSHRLPQTAVLSVMTALCKYMVELQD